MTLFTRLGIQQDDALCNTIIRSLQPHIIGYLEHVVDRLRDRAGYSCVDIAKDLIRFHSSDMIKMGLQDWDIDQEFYRDMVTYLPQVVQDKMIFELFRRKNPFERGIVDKCFSGLVKIEKYRTSQEMMRYEIVKEYIETEIYEMVKGLMIAIPDILEYHLKANTMQVQVIGE